MPSQEKEVVCTHCLKPFSAVPKITFGGFQKYLCPHCHKIVHYPLARKALYWIIPVIVVFIFFIVALSLLETEGGDSFLIFLAGLPIWIDEKKSLLLWPLFLWSLVRLGGMYNKKVLEISRKILYGCGILALLAVITALLGFTAGVVRLGIIWPPLIAALVLLGFYLYGLQKDAAIRKKIQAISR
jgi:hypothetical protein